jgi:hypothetical protein
MKKMIIFEPAMCCPTGLCGPSFDKDLLRISTVLNNLKANGVEVERHNLTNNPKIFVDNKEIRKMLIENGVEILPVTMVDGVVVKTRDYPTNGEFISLLDVPAGYLRGKSESDCGCSDGCC